MALSKMTRIISLNVQAYRTPLFLTGCIAFYMTADHLLLRRLLVASQNVGLLHHNRPVVTYLRNHANNN